MNKEDLDHYVKEDLLKEGDEVPNQGLGDNCTPYTYLTHGYFNVCIKNVSGEFINIPIEKFDFTPPGLEWRAVKDKKVFLRVGDGVEEEFRIKEGLLFQLEEI